MSLNLSDNPEVTGSNSDVSALNVLWRTETNSPEILPFQTKLIADLLETLTIQQVMGPVVNYIILRYLESNRRESC